jgi:uncharacterized repeat protein (TIGR01451 family)
MTGKRWGILAAVTLLAIGAQPTLAQNTGTLTSKVELEKLTPGKDGEPATRTYLTPDVVVPGDRVRISLAFTNNGAEPASGVVIANPIPQALMFDGTDDQAGFGVSVDGGKQFAPLSELSVPVEGTKPRAATEADVTHVRWKWPDPIAPGQTRTVAFFGRVR